MKWIKLFEGFEKDDYYQEIDYDTFDKMSEIYYPDCFLNKYEIDRITKICMENNIRIINIEKKYIKDTQDSVGLKIISTGFLTTKGSIYKVEDGWYLFKSMSSEKYRGRVLFFKCDQIEGLEELLKDKDIL